MRFLINKYSNGQSLLELAILSSILLFAIGALIQVGTSYNRNQDLMMRNQRNVIAMAYNPLYRDFSRHCSLTMLEDQVTHETVNGHKVKKITPYMSNATAVWSNKIFYDYEFEPGNTSADTIRHLAISQMDLPAQQVLINNLGTKTFYHLPTASYKVTVGSYLPVTIHEDTYALWAGKTKGLPYIQDAAKLINPLCWYRSRVFSNSLEKGDQADIDYDGKLEDILDKYNYNIITAMDHQEGMMDNTIDSQDVRNNDDYYTTNPSAQYEPLTQGIQPDYAKESSITSASLRNEQTPAETVNTWSIGQNGQGGYRDKITHEFKYNEDGTQTGLYDAVQDILGNLNINIPDRQGTFIAEIAGTESKVWRTPK